MSKTTRLWPGRSVVIATVALAISVTVCGTSAASAFADVDPPGVEQDQAGSSSPLGPLEELVATAVREQFSSNKGSAAGDASAAPPLPASELVPLPEPAAPPIDLEGRTPSGWLTPVNHYWLSARFGEPGPWSSGHHTGLDFVAPLGTPLRAPVAGVVVAAAPGGAYGKLLQLRVAPGVELWFAHLRRFDVEVGSHVNQGQSLGRVGVSGHTTGPHSHFEVRVRGRARNPERYFWPSGNIAVRH